MKAGQVLGLRGEGEFILNSRSFILPAGSKPIASAPSPISFDLSVASTQLLIHAYVLFRVSLTLLWIPNPNFAFVIPFWSQTIPFLTNSAGKSAHLRIPTSVAVSAANSSPAQIAALSTIGDPQNRPNRQNSCDKPLVGRRMWH